MEIFKKEYCSESIYDLERDVYESLDPAFNPKVKDIEVDEYGFTSGTYTVTIKWEEDND